MKAGRPVILTLSDYYVPGYRAGGPVRTLEAVVSLLGDEFEFWIVTRDRDLGSSRPYPTVKPNTWQAVGPAKVMYLPPARLTPPAIAQVIRSCPHEILYLNSLFSVPFAIAPLALRRIGLIPRRPVVMAPRGELSPGALSLKPRKKSAYLATSRVAGIFRGVLWQSSSPHEVLDIRRVFGARSQVFVAPDLAVAPADPTGNGAGAITKEPGSLRALFLGRISRMKNLDGALAILSRVQGDVDLAIYGPIEDAGYWKDCRSLIDRLPGNITVTYEGEVEPQRIPEVISSRQLLFLPTLGENYGHVILETLALGRPVLISDRTRWRDLEAAGVGWDIDLDKPDEFRRALASCVAMDSVSWRAMCAAAARYGADVLKDPEVRMRNRALFRSCLQRAHRDSELGATTGRG